MKVCFSARGSAKRPLKSDGQLRASSPLPEACRYGDIFGSALRSPPTFSPTREGLPRSECVSTDPCEEYERSYDFNAIDIFPSRAALAAFFQFSTVHFSGERICARNSRLT
jgi:hypothetical protein